MIKIYNEDCFKFLPAIADSTIDLILIDPPYKISRETGFRYGAKTGRNVDRFRISMKFGDWDEYTGAKDMSDLKAYIEKRGGHLRSAVSSKTDYLICNNQSEETVKLKKAKELGVPIITETEFLKMAEEKED